MPKIFEWDGFKFFFFSNEGNPLERCHIHVRKDSKIAKFWILPEVRIDSSWGMSSKELKILEEKILEKRSFIEEKWNEFFNK